MNANSLLRVCKQASPLLETRSADAIRQLSKPEKKILCRFARLLLAAYLSAHGPEGKCPFLHGFGASIPTFTTSATASVGAAAPR